MGIADRRERNKEALRLRIIEGARDIVSEEGLDRLSIRSIADRIEYSPATIYLYFEDKEALVRAVGEEGFRMLDDYMRSATDEDTSAGSGAGWLLGPALAYARFAIENTAYFRLMFDLPGVPSLEAGIQSDDMVPMTKHLLWDRAVRTVHLKSFDDDQDGMERAERRALAAWALVHGIVSLYVSGHLVDKLTAAEDLFELLRESLTVLCRGWQVQV
jgi:AcrR family transcriptional regulator